MLQSIHLNPGTEEGQEILSVLLAVPRYQRGALIRAILREHLAGTALQRWPGLKRKSPEEVLALVTNRPVGRAKREARAPAGAIPQPLQGSQLKGEDAGPRGDQDIETRLDQLDFSRFTFGLNR